MSRDKQIEEMQNALIDISKQPIMIEGLEHWSDVIAEDLYAKGYRKSSELVREIIDTLKSAGINEWRYPVIAELKKKYESEKDNGEV